MRLHELLNHLSFVDPDAEVEDRFGDDVVRIKVQVMDGRRFVRLLTDASDYKRDIEQLEQRCDDLTEQVDAIRAERDMLKLDVKEFCERLERTLAKL